MANLGDGITSKIHELQVQGLNFMVSRTQGNDIYKIDNSRYRLSLVVNPKRWLGLDFAIKDQKGKIQLWYSIDNDLYPVTGAKYGQIAEELESDIINFLAMLADKKVMLGIIKGKQTMVFPVKNGYELIKKGKLFQSSKVCSQIEYEKLLKDLVPFLAIPA